MKIKVGIIDSLIETDNPDILRVLSDKWSFFQKGYQYNPNYRKHRWDGRKRFVTLGGKFKTGMLSLILNDLERIGCTPEIERLSDIDFKHSPYKTYIDGLRLTEYQEKAVNEAFAQKRGVIVSPTGSGKTMIMASIISGLTKHKVVILFDERSILLQTYEYLKKAQYKNIGICMGGEYQDGHIMLCMVQSIEKIIDSYVKEAKVLLVDEVHKFANGDLALAAIHSFPNAVYRFGFTATMPTDEVAKHNLIGAFGPIIETKTTKQLIEDGVLAKPDIQLIEHNPELTPEDEDLTFREIYVKFITNSEPRNNLIIKLCKKIEEGCPGAKVCILVKDLDHLYYLKSKLNNCYTIEGINIPLVRQQTITTFVESVQTSFLIGTKVLQTGINIKQITHLINARGLKDRIPTIQGLGRALRITESKKEVKVYDFFDNVPFLKKHSKERIEHYKKEGHEIRWIKL